MPWQEVCPMDEKVRFIAAVLAEEQSMAELCESFGVSRKTGYKWLARYAERGPEGLYDLSRAPHRVPWAISPAQGIGTMDAGRGQPAVSNPQHAVPRDAAILAAPRQHAMPEADRVEAEHLDKLRSKVEQPLAELLAIDGASRNHANGRTHQQEVVQ